MSTEDTPRFADLGLSAAVLEALERVGYEHPTPIQAQSIPPLLEGRDLLGTAQTGTGKTAAFALPLLSRLDVKRRQPQVLVLAPTRELAIQVAEAFQSYAAAMKGFHVLPIYGGQSMGIQLRQLQRGAHVVVGTPGRVMDHLRRGTLKLDALRTVVLDEADEMLRMGFIDDVQWILEHTPDSRQVALFSATMPAPIRRVADTHLREPAQIRIASRTSTVERVEQSFWLVADTSKLDAITRILEATDHDGVIVFVRTKIASENLASRLEARGHDAAAINGDMTQAQREATIARLKSGAVDILVATDVAARGIDVARISHVINYDIPYDTEAYVHRIGRTGRAGRAGAAILFVAPRERRMLASIERATGQKMTPLELPSKAEVERIRTGRFKEEISTVLAEVPLRPQENLLRDYLEETGADLYQVAAALAWMAQRDPGGPKKEPEAAPFEESSGRPPRSERPERAPRRERTAAPSPSAKGEATDAPELELFHLSVGREHGVQPGDIVGAIANEAELDSKHIGRIRLFDHHSTVELPVGMPRELMQILRRVRVRSVPLGLRRADEEPGAEADDPIQAVRRGAKRPSGPRKPTRKKDGPANRKGPRSTPRPNRGKAKRDR
ncbi:MAG: DEAD/DEAH box helicase [Pseudomonadales bacterium]|jgi:ATP-dependent RNA helicase DeaD|nr:DEAD/DEAH box helicase [Pseudomonadales bacterium]